MFGLPRRNHPDKLLNLFCFKSNNYDVRFDEIEIGFLWFTEMKKRYYISCTTKTKTEGKDLYLAYCPDFASIYQWVYWGEVCEYKKIIYWDDSNDPINLITYLKSKLDEESHKDFVIFSSADLG